MLKQYETDGVILSKKIAKSNKTASTKIINVLLEDPTRSMRELARELGSNRQTIWRKKKLLEKEKIIWGYTAVVDEGKQGKGTFLIMMKTKPMTKEMAEIVYHERWD